MHLLNRIVLSVFVFSLSVLANAANLRESVCYIQKSSDGSTDKSEQIVDALRENSYINASKRFKDNYEHGFSGSGFVIKDSNGKLIVVTNKHVVGSFKHVDLNFEVDGATVKYSHCPVFYTSQNVDLAFVGFPSESVKAIPLPINASRPKDGSEVWSVGFPSLDHAPSWQIGKGIVSNNSVKNEHFGNVDSISVIQHTAQIHFGSSGGPLLVKKGEDDYEVVGINTWKAIFRENTGFSVPVEEIVKAMNNEPTAAASNANASNKIAKQFLDDAKSGNVDMSKYISDEYVLSLDKNAVSSLIKTSSTQRKSELRNEDPMTVLKRMLADKLLNLNDDINKVELESVVDDADGFKSAYTYKNKKSELIWKNGVEGLQIANSSASVNDIIKDPNESVFFEPGWTFQLDFGTQLPMTSISGNHFMIMPSITFGKIGFLGWCLGYGWDYVHMPGKGEWSDFGIDDGPITERKEKHLDLNYRMGVQFPLALGASRKQFVMPFVLGSAGYELGGFDYESGFQAGYHIGLRYGWQMEKVEALMISAELHRKRTNYFDWDIDEDMDADGCDLTRHSYLEIHLSVGF